MTLCLLLSRLVWVVGVVVWRSSTPTLAQATPPQGFLNDVCVGYRGVAGTCQLLSCPSLQHDLISLPLPEFIGRHGPSCALDLFGNKLVCCPAKPEDHAAESCGISRLGEHMQGGLADPGSWPWLAVLYLPDEIIGWTPVGCLGALLSDRHVLVFADCANQDLYVVLGEYRRFNHTGVQNITSRVAVQNMHWSNHVNFAILILETPAILQPNKVWPVCLSMDPVADLGFDLNGLTSGQKLVSFSPFWPSSHQEPGTVPLHQSQAFLSNCSTFCKKELDPTISCPYYNASRGNLNPLCVGGMTVAECESQSGVHAQPVIVQSVITREFFLVGLTKSTHCHSFNFNNLVIPVTPYAKDILQIIG